ncbi:mucolipin [Anaeramoeba flamelloides]|uniref:Mucolipin n=1 Tax=Anaeramoeba flamelloides TaxID=1746091 RepID=A0AAV7YWU2_9EUKA|nr:mucolipin [Anaeramoeba flamelloides]
MRPSFTKRGWLSSEVSKGFIQKRRIPLHHYLTVSPFQKFRKHRRIPIKFILQILITFNYTSKNALYQQSNQNAFTSLFLPDSLGYLDSKTGQIRKEIYNLEEFTNFINETVNKFYQFKQVSVGYYDYVIDPDGEIEPPKMIVEQYKSVIFDHFSFTKPVSYEYTKESYKLTTDDPYGPFIGTKDEIQQTIAIFRSATISFKFKNIFPSDIPQCLVWKVEINFDFVCRGGVITTSISSDPSICSNNTFLVGNFLTFTFFSILLIILFSVALLFFSLRSILFSSQLYQVTSQQLINEGSERLISENFPSKVSFILAFINFWDIWNVITTVILLISEIYYFTIFMFDNQLGDFALILSLGFSFFCCWFGLTGYFQWSPKFYSLTSATVKALPKVFRFILGTLPLLLAYAFLGTICFGSYSKNFATIDQSIVTLFSVANGDIVRDTFSMVYKNSHGMGVLSRIYMYTFVCIFIYVWVNLFITVVGEAYISIVKEPQSSMRRKKRILKKFIIRLYGRTEKPDLEIQEEDSIDGYNGKRFHKRYVSDENESDYESEKDSETDSESDMQELPENDSGSVTDSGSTSEFEYSDGESSNSEDENLYDENENENENENKNEKENENIYLQDQEEGNKEEENKEEGGEIIEEENKEEENKEEEEEIIEEENKEREEEIKEDLTEKD